MRVGDFCKVLGIHRSTILRLEARGVIKSKRDWAGHRRYTDEDIRRVEGLLYQNGDQENTHGEQTTDVG